MRTSVIIWREICLVFLLTGLLRSAPAVDWYVATNGAGLGTNGWAYATNNLQGAIGKSAINDTIWVSNGVYDTGGLTNYPSSSYLTNRLVINKAITVRSKDNDPANTVIKGAWDPVATNGPAAVRCVYMSAGSLIGFTITNGATLTNGTVDLCGGGVYCSDTTPVISNCVIVGNRSVGSYNAGPYGGGGAWFGTLRNCTLAKNFSLNGGGAMRSALYNCSLISNSAVFNGGTGGSTARGGGANWSTLYNCALIGNTSTESGGGAGYLSTLYNCTLIGNSSSAGNGGGANDSDLYNCTLTSNTASSGLGGGANSSDLFNCLVTGNFADGGGGAYAGTAYNCTVVGNRSNNDGGGVRLASVYNSIVYFNTSTTRTSTNSYGGSFTYSCTIGPVVAGAGNISEDPMLVDKGSAFGTSHIAGNYRLAARSPCINAGTFYSWMSDGSVRSKDLDYMQRVRYGTVDMGAFENVRAGSIYGFH